MKFPTPLHGVAKDLAMITEEISILSRFGIVTFILAFVFIIFSLFNSTCHGCRLISIRIMTYDQMDLLLHKDTIGFSNSGNWLHHKNIASSLMILVV